jgi:hypothetical protein
MRYPLRGPLPALKPLIVLALALAAAAPARSQSPDCPAAYQDSYRAQWEIEKPDWAKFCAHAGEPQAALGEAQAAFMESCKAGAQPSVQAKLVRADDAAAMCAQGVPGRARIPRPAGAAPAAGSSRAPPARAAAAEDQAGRRAAAGVGSAASRIGAALGGDVASLYGERTGEAGGVEASPTPGYAAGKVAGAAAAAVVGISATAPPPVQDPSLPIKAVPPPPYNPSDKEKAPYLITLDQRLAANGASPEAVAYLRERYHDMLEHLDAHTLQNLVNNNQNLAIIPKDKKLTDVAPFTELKGKKTFDGRPWEGVRGVAGVPMGAGKPGCAVAIGEENLTGNGGGYPKGFTFFHEYGHAVMGSGLDPKTPPPSGWMDTVTRAMWGDPPTKQHIKEIYDASMKRPEKTGLDAYANSNDDEFFAQSTAAFFGVGYKYLKAPKDKTLFQETPVTLAKANSDVFKLCISIYGRPGRYWAR